MNLTPPQVIEDARFVLGGFDLDPASCYEAQQIIQAKEYYTLESSGLSEKWVADTLWLNPPGRSRDKGKHVSAADWGNKLSRCHKDGLVKSSIYLAYRSGSLGSIGALLKGAARICLTTNLATSKVISGVGRISYETINSAGRRVSETSNTQSSALILTTENQHIISKFDDVFSGYGIVLKGI